MVQEQQPQASDIINLGIWGTSSAGKSVYMLMLYHYLTQTEENNGWNVMILDSKTDIFITTELSRMVDRGEFPLPTTSSQQYCYLLQRASDRKKFRLTFLDSPGETLQDRAGKLHNNENESETVVDYLLKCHGILILLSPLQEDRDRLNSSYFTLLGNLLRSMQTQSGSFKLEQYVVFGITKADREVIYHRLCDVGDNLYQLFIEIVGGQANLTWLKQFFYVKTEKEQPKKVLLAPGKDNRCHFTCISPFARYQKDGETICPVIPNENKTEDEPKVNESQQEQPKAGDKRQQKQREDPFGKNSSKKQNNSNDDYETPSTPNNSEDSQGESQSSSNDDYETPSTANNDEANQQEQGKYKINKDITWRPLNVVEPIEWLIKGIENHPPQIFTNQQQQSNNS